MFSLAGAHGGKISLTPREQDAARRGDGEVDDAKRQVP
jgi:hypothetical protein